MKRPRPHVFMICLSLVAAACQATPTAVADGFCDAAINAQLAVAQGPDVDFETATEEDINTALGEFAARVNPLLDDVEANAPEDLQGEVATVVENTRTAMETGDEAALESEEYQQAELAVGQFVVDNCDIQSYTVEGFDYGYSNLPASAQAGRVAFVFDNTGEELHEMIIFKINDESLTVEQLLEMPEEEAMTQVTFTGVGFAEVGGEDIVFADLEAGRYAVVCFIPVGTKSFEDLPEDDSEATQPPHFTQGMVAEFSVEG